MNHVKRDYGEQHGKFVLHPSRRKWRGEPLRSVRSMVLLWGRATGNLWSHARTFPHRFIVELVSRNRWARRIFNLTDDVFYGRKPRPKAPPAWAQPKAEVGKCFTEHRC
ncbi:MAG: hypothetical protein JW836_13045 [Deltaproteobacteria bacterium]|nr:hypothetical protein [Deltaproteobacteria bacterium]